MKITIFISAISNGGAERVACRLASNLVNMGHSVTILTFSETECTYDIDNKVIIKTLSRNHENFRLARVLRKVVRLGNYVKLNNLDTYISFLPINTAMLLLFKYRIKGKVIISERSNPSSYGLLERCMVLWSAKKSDGIVFQRDDAKAFYLQKNGRLPVCTVIPNAISDEFFKVSRGNCPEPRIVAVGRLDENKNYEMLFSAFSEFAKGNYFKLDIYGEGNRRKKLEQDIVSLGLQDRITLHGNVNDVGAKIKDAYMFAMTSGYEGIPNALLEAMAIGIPCISTKFDGGYAEKLIQDKVSGILIEKNDAGGLVDAFNYLSNHPEAALKMGESAKVKTLEFKENYIYPKWNDFILKCCSEGK